MGDSKYDSYCGVVFHKYFWLTVGSFFVRKKVFKRKGAFLQEGSTLLVEYIKVATVEKESY